MNQTAPVLAAMADTFRTQYANTLFVTEGDTYIAGPFFTAGADPSINGQPGVASTALGRPDVAIMNLLGVNASAIGNHEFDNGSAVLQGAIAPSGAWVGAQFPFISANLDTSADSALSPSPSPAAGSFDDQGQDRPPPWSPSAARRSASWAPPTRCCWS